MNKLSAKQVWKIGLEGTVDHESYEAYVSAPQCWTGPKMREAMKGRLGEEVVLTTQVESVGMAYNLSNSDLPETTHEGWWKRLLRWLRVI